MRPLQDPLSCCNFSISAPPSSLLVSVYASIRPPRRFSARTKLRNLATKNKFCNGLYNTSRRNSGLQIKKSQWYDGATKKICMGSQAGTHRTNEWSSTLAIPCGFFLYKKHKTPFDGALRRTNKKFSNTHCAKCSMETAIVSSGDCITSLFRNDLLIFSATVFENHLWSAFFLLPCKSNRQGLVRVLPL